MILKYMYCQIRNFLKFILLHGGAGEEHLRLDGEPWVVSHVGGEYGCIWSMTYSITKKFTFSFIKGTHAHYVQFEECTANILVNLFKIGFYEY